jgi:vancomycin resistance protein VanJ
MSGPEKGFLHRWGTAANWVYLTWLLLWATLYFLTGDLIPHLALVNNLAVYLFVPLPLVLLAGIFFRRREIWLGGGLGLIVFAVLWGPLFLPSLSLPVEDGPVLTVMTYNVLGRHARTAPVIETIMADSPDVVLIQELNPSVAAALELDLGEAYPYQVLDPVEGVTGMGVISRFPLVDSGDTLPLDWVGEPQVLGLNWDGRRVQIVNVHLYPSGLGSATEVAYLYRLREEQARALSAFAHQAGATAPIVAGGDANVTSLSGAYRIITDELKDAWWQAGFGLGHTFPGSDIPGSSRPEIAGRPVPMWLARIDYIFHSDHWRTEGAWLGRFDGVSDHRAVIARLTLKEPK